MVQEYATVWRVKPAEKGELGCSFLIPRIFFCGVDFLASRLLGIYPDAASYNADKVEPCRLPEMENIRS
jgi:hypothetical protein